MSVKEKVIGIDLASSQSVCAVINEQGKPEAIINEEGKRLTPSVIFIDENGERKIGATAQRQAITKPKNTVALIKRFMGGEYDSTQIQDAISRATFDVVNKGNKPYVNINGQEYSPEELSSFIVSYLKTQAENFYGTDVKKAVITCPAFYNDAQRNAVKIAGELAGLEVLRVINEPTAAILSANNIDLSTDKKILVVDLGGSTLDFSLCDVSDSDGAEVVEILASYGDTYLGGADFDHEIVEYICNEFAKENNGFDLRQDQMAYTRIVEAAEKAKCELSLNTKTDINLPYITVIDGQPKMLVMELTRATYERLTQGLIDRMINCGLECIKKAGIDKSEIDEILLVGGMTRSVNVQNALTNTFGCPLNKSVNPDEAVALGAAIQANVLVGGDSSKDILLLDVTPLSVGIETDGKVMTVMIEGNTTIPTQKKQVFTTSQDNQPAVSIRVFQGERQFTADNKLVGEFELGGILPARRGVPQIEVTFDIDANGILKVSAKDLGTNKENTITITSDNSLTPEEIERIKADAEKYKAEDAKRKEDVDKLNNAEGYAYSVRNSLDEETVKSKLSEDDKKMLDEKIADVISSAQTKDVEKTETAKKALEEAFNPIMQKVYAEAQAQPMNEAGGCNGDCGCDGNCGDDCKCKNNAEDVTDVEFEEVK